MTEDKMARLMDKVSRLVSVDRLNQALIAVLVRQMQADGKNVVVPVSDVIDAVNRFDVKCEVTTCAHEDGKLKYMDYILSVVDKV